MSDKMRYEITPIAKPRMTQQDKWLYPPRPCVQRYRIFRDKVKIYQIKLPQQGAKITFVLQMPKSWSKKKKKEYHSQPHQQKPDLSNLLKALEDSIYQDDSGIWQYKELKKIWGKKGVIEIEY